MWLGENRIIDKSKSNFWNSYENYKTEYPDEFSRVFQTKNGGNVRIDLDKVKLCLNYKIDYGEPTIEIDFDILLNEKEIGWYREIYFTNGEFVDDYFVIE
jgi:hypothetical protein